VNIESVSGKRMSDIIARILEHVGYKVSASTETTYSSSKQVGGGLDLTLKSPGGDFVPLDVKFGAKVDRSSSGSEKSIEQFVVKSPTDSKVLDICEELSIHLVLDEIHMGSPEFKQELATFIKAYANKSCENFHIALLGTTSDATELVQRDPGIDRILHEIRLPALADEEARYIVEYGMSSLSIELSAELIDKIAKTSVGSPGIVQNLSLEVAERAFARDKRVAVDEDLEEALGDFVSQKFGRLNSSYLKAIETVGTKRYRKQILRAMADCPEAYVTMDWIRSQVSKYLATNIPSTALSGPLRDLKENDEPVLEDVQRNVDGVRVHNYTTFVDPAMKAFVRLRIVAEEKGLLGAGSENSH
jgi:hypothetical protein